MGTVHLAKMDGPEGFNKLAVVKELRADLADSREFIQMFLDEARLAARLTHPNVVHTYGANQEDGRLYLALEYLDGQPWSRIRHTLWESGSLPYTLHVKVLAEVLAGLHYAHELRDYDGTPLCVVHCDMSPQNVFVTYDGQVKVVDFGVARGMTRGPSAATRAVIGKIAYMAPEQARGDELDRRTDIFSVGVMLWEALAGRRFVDGSDWSEIRRRRAVGDEPRARELGPTVPKAFSEICDRALALDPDERFSTAAEFREVLLGALNHDMQDVDRVRLGELVSQAFARDRARVHALIERHLKGGSRFKSSIEDLVASLQGSDPAEHTLKADLTELASVSRLPSEMAVIEASHSASLHVKRRKQPLKWVGACALAVGLLGAGFALRSSVMSHSGEGAANSAPPALPLPSPAAPAQLTASVATAADPQRTGGKTEASAQTIELVITADPPEASLQLDGVQLASNPYTGRVRKSSGLHVVRASGPMLQSQEQVITLEQDQVIAFNLSSLPTLPAGSARGVRPRAPAPARRAGANSGAVAPPSEDTPAPAATPPVHAQSADGFDTPVRPHPPANNNGRVIYDEDPYR